MITLEMIQEAQEALHGISRKTPLDHAPKIGENVYIKAENLQLTGAFKLRGAYNKIRSLSPEEAAKGVIACSAGNHAQGIALSATKLGIKSIICMPAGAPISKVEATKGYGAEVVLVPGVYDDAAKEAERLVQEKGYTFAHPFNDPYVIAGQGTIGLEILEQLPEVDQVVVPIGGGGLISGIALAVKSLKPSCKVIGVQAASVASMYTSRRKGKVTTVSDGDTIADGIHVLTPGELTFELCQKYVDEIVTVSEDEIAAAILALMESQKTVAEGAGATPVAAVMFGKVDTTVRKTVCVVSGGNVDVTTLSRILTKGLSKSGRITEISTKIIDKPGSLIQLLQIVSETGANIMKINHAREDKHSDVGACIVSMVLETRNVEHVRKIENALTSKGYFLLSQ
ncbi:L-threonine ammonia-lyase [anaerobic digester metagenome]|jgi:threonine dehydratase|uniref:threonine ammonia-lyase n=1 Tax=Oscillibacter ruminantium TaxID=1263547 RepID=UPI002B212B2A|nr:threonine ammonia-lyase [Oscillibacter ruminantium]MEA5041920.1 threonine ammonia-lyase [Oscillibacter ruminantium]